MDYLVNINDFHGPLDLLLHLVKTAKMDIYEINTNVIIEEYLAYIEKMQNLNIDIASEFLVMATSLIHLKSKMLLGLKEENEELNNEDEFGINSEEDLKNRIIEYEKYKNVTNIFKDLEDKRSNFYTKSPESLTPYIDETISKDSNVSIDDLVAAFLAYQERLNYQKPLHTKITHRELSVEDKILNIKEILKQRRKVDFLELFTELNRENVVVTFLAILQMAKNEEIVLKQDNNFGNISLESR